MVMGLILWEPFLHFAGIWERDDIHLDTIKSVYHSQMEMTPSIKVFAHRNHYAVSPVVQPFPRLCQHLIKVPKLQTISEESKEPDTFEPFGSDYPLSWHTLSCFLFEEQSKRFANVPLLWLPPSHFPTFISLSKPPKNLPPSTGINHLEDQIKCILHYEDLIDKICSDQLPVHQIQQEQLEELSPVERLANKLRETLA